MDYISLNKEDFDKECKKGHNKKETHDFPLTRNAFSNPMNSVRYSVQTLSPDVNLGLSAVMVGRCIHASLQLLKKNA